MRPPAQSKLVRVVKGKVLDVAVDIRRGSPTFGRHVAVELTAENKRQFFVPRGFAHGFSVLSDEAVFQYKCDNLYAPESEGAIAWNDPAIGIDWRLRDRLIVSIEGFRKGYDRIPLAEETRFIATMNYGYAGTRELNEALTSRFAVIQMPTITEENLEKLLRAQFADLTDKYVHQFALLFLDLQRNATAPKFPPKRWICAECWTLCA